MKTLRLSVLLGIVMLMIAFSLLLFGYRLFVYTVQHPFVPAMVGLSLKVIVYLALASFGVFLYRLLTNYQQRGFFDGTSVRLIRWIGYAALLIALINPIVLSMEADNGFGTSAGAFIAGTIQKFVFESPLLLLVGLLTYLLADFMQKAITVKRDNESFI